MTTREWKETGLQIAEVAGGVMVRQDSRAYKARRWSITSEVVEIVDSAIRRGLRASRRGAITSRLLVRTTKGGFSFSGAKQSRRAFRSSHSIGSNGISFIRRVRHTVGNTLADTTSSSRRPM